MMAKAVAAATAWVVNSAASLGRKAKRPSRRPASAGFPIQPSPREARVMPSWVAEMYRSREAMALRARAALRSPSRACSSSRVRRAPTRANSAATKKALASTSSTTATRPGPTGVVAVSMGAR